MITVIINLITNIPIDICNIVAEYYQRDSDAYLAKIKNIIETDGLCVSCLSNLHIKNLFPWDQINHYHCGSCLNGLFCKSCSKQCTRCYLRSCENCTDFHTETGCVACDEVYSHLTEEIKQKHCDDFLFIYTQNYSNAFENIEYKKIQPISQYIDEFNIIEEYKKYLVRIGDVDGESETNSDDLADEVD